MTHRVALALGAVLLPTAALLAVSPTWAGPPTEQLRGFFAAATRILHDPALDGKPDERLTAIRGLARGMFDFREAARLALGAEWAERTPAEREQFVRLFSDLLERAFIAGVAARTQIADGVKVTFVSESVDGQAAVVRTTMLGRNGHDLPFDYRLVERDGRWIARDVAIDGVSLTANYRAQFTRVIQASSYPELVRQMQERFTVATVATAEQAAAARAVGEPAQPPPAPERGMPPPASAPDGIIARPVSAAATLTDGASSPVSVRPGPDVVGSAGIAPPIPRPAPDSPPARADPNRDMPSRRGSRESIAAAPPRAAAPPARLGSPASVAYWVQVAALRSLEAAKRMATALQGERLLASDRWAVVMAPGSGAASGLTRVRVGPFADRTAASSGARELEARGYHAFVAEDRN